MLYSIHFVSKMHQRIRIFYEGFQFQSLRFWAVQDQDWVISLSWRITTPTADLVEISIAIESIRGLGRHGERPHPPNN